MDSERAGSGQGPRCGTAGIRLDGQSLSTTPMGPPPQNVRVSAPAPADEAELVGRLRDGDRAAFATLVGRHGGALLRFTLSFLKDAALAEEAVQDTWLALLGNLEGFEGRSSLRTWLFHIAANKARTRLTRERRSVPFSSLASPEEPGDQDGLDRFDQGGMWRDPPSAWAEDNPERLAQSAEARVAIESAIATLPEAQRAVMTLRDIEGLETEEICSILGVTVSNQRVLLHRARSRVRLALERYMAGVR